MAAEKIEMKDFNQEEVGKKITREDLASQVAALDPEKKVKKAIMRADLYNLYNAKIKDERVHNSTEADKILRALYEEYEVCGTEKEFNDHVIANKTGQKLKNFMDRAAAIRNGMQFIQQWDKDHTDENTIRKALGLDPVPLALDETQFKFMYDLGILKAWGEAQEKNGLNMWKYRIADYIAKVEKAAQLKKYWDKILDAYISRATNLKEEPPAQITLESGMKTVNQNYLTWLEDRRQLLTQIDQELKRARWEALPEQLTLWDQLKANMNAGNSKQGLEAIVMKMI